jgi:hypothetical protein
VEFESLNAADGGDGLRRWIEAGRPTIPTLVVDGNATPVLHVSQIAEALGLPAPPGGSPARDAEEALTVLGAWIETLRDSTWEALLEPTPARGRTLRNLTVNVFHPFELLPQAWRSGEFPWHPEDDGAREQRLESLEDLLDVAVVAAEGWQSFLEEGYLASGDRMVESPRGSVGFSALVSFQRWHAAYHYRQLVHVLGGEPELDLTAFALPRDVF